MPPRHAYWTILIDNQPTAFRAHDPEELLPTLNRLREKNETAVMKWFERGKLFDSRDAARQGGFGKGERRWEGPRPDRPDHPDRPEDGGGDGKRARDHSWRPGGEHRDPRQKYKDAKKAKWQRFKEKIRERHEQRVTRDPQAFTPPHGDKLRARPGSTGGDRPRGSHDRQSREWRHDEPRDRHEPPRDSRTERTRREDWRRDARRDAERDPHRSSDQHDRRAAGHRDDRRSRPRDDRWQPRGETRDGAPSRPHGDKYRQQRPNWRTRNDERSRPPQRDWPRDANRGEEKPKRPPHDRPAWRDRPPRSADQRGGWRPKGPAGVKPKTSAKKPHSPRRRRDDDE